MPRNDANHRSAVLRLARLRGLQPFFVDASGVRRRAPIESLTRVLEAMGSPAATAAQARASNKDFEEQSAARRLEPVTVAWQGRAAAAKINLALGRVKGRLSCSLLIEGGQEQHWTCHASSLRVSRPGRGGPSSAALPLPRHLPPGYHSLTVEIDGRAWRSRVICAAERCYRRPDDQAGHAWGVFAPVYSLRSERSLGCGDLTDLEGLADWSASLGGRVVATLPILSSHLGVPFDPSPYSPVSRLFWNELFLDAQRVPELARCPGAQRLLSSSDVRAEAVRLRGLPLVDYRATAGLKRRILEPLAQQFFADGGEHSEPFLNHVRANPLIERYATFCAVLERRASEWNTWPARLQKGEFGTRDFNEDARLYHLYCQYAMARSLGEWSTRLKKRHGLVYLDLPVGVSPAGFDTFQHRDLFMFECSTGAPPDPYFTGGQDWGFAPIHPDAQRESGYEYLAASLRHHMRFADYLRLDHVMCFHRLFVIPRGASPGEGLYLSYRPEEAYAVLSLESHRAHCRLVGENLGTVPPEVNRALARHDLCGLYVAQYKLQPSATRALRPVPANCVASVNTHDMAPLATFWSETDIEDRIALGMLRAEERNAEAARRQRIRRSLVRFLAREGLIEDSDTADVSAIRDAILAFLARSPADFVLLNLEDLWLESKWQNIPGTLDEHPNWRRRLRLSLEDIHRDESIARLMKRIDAWRAGGDPDEAHPSPSAQRRRKNRTPAKVG